MVGAEERVFVDDLDHWRAQVARFEAEVGRAVIGQDRVIRVLTIAILSRGHVLLEGDVGVGKTTLLRSVARALGGPYERVEGTIDLMPADLVYHASSARKGGRGSIPARCCATAPSWRFSSSTRSTAPAAGACAAVTADGRT